MGFRTVIISEDSYATNFPMWFKDKYEDYLNFGSGEKTSVFPISTKYEAKYYNDFDEDDFLLDLQKSLIECEFLTEIDDKLVLILLHECDGITKLEIYKDKILGMEPIEWKPVANVTHSYCYGCSDYENLTT